MTSLTRIRQLRIADVRARILDARDECDYRLSGSHPIIGFMGFLRWLASKPGKTYDDYLRWRDAVIRAARERKATLQKRLARVDRIARTHG